MKVLYDRVITEYGFVRRPDQGPRVIFDSDAKRTPQNTLIIRVGARKHLVLSVPEHSGLETSGGRVLVVLVLVGHGLTDYDEPEEVSVYRVVHSIYEPDIFMTEAVHARVAEGFDPEMSDQQISHEVKGLCHEGTTRTRE